MRSTSIGSIFLKRYKGREREREMEKVTIEKGEEERGTYVICMYTHTYIYM